MNGNRRLAGQSGFVLRVCRVTVLALVVGLLCPALPSAEDGPEPAGLG